MSETVARFAEDKPSRKLGGGSGTAIRRWPWILAGLIVIGFVVAVLGIIFVPGRDVWTDDAYVAAHYATIAPRVSGQIATVQVRDNQLVQAGQVLATLDDHDYRNAATGASGRLQRDRAEEQAALALVSRQNSLIGQDRAQIASIEAQLEFARSDAGRYTRLSSTGAATIQERQRADSLVRQERAALRGARAALAAAAQEIGVLEAQAAALQGTVHADEAQLNQARLDLSYTVIRAPLDGWVGQRSLQVGNYVGPGMPLMAIVPVKDIYVQANYRERALRHVRPGQAATIHVDAYNVDLQGIVESIAPASGAVFAPIAPEDATGNFTKIVQRLPVKIVPAPNQPLARLLRAGFSVETTIHTRRADMVGPARRGRPLITPQKATN